MSDKTQSTLLVTGASGQLGRQVVELLLEQDAGHAIIATTRSPEKLSDLAERGVTVRRADFDDTESLPEAFAGADRLLLISTDAVDAPGKRLQQHLNAVQAAEQAGVKHVVYTSLIEADDSPVTFAPDHAGTEQALADSGMGWTVLRNNLYMDMLPNQISQAYQMGGIFGASGDGKAALITREDCARAAAGALVDSFDGTRTLDVTGVDALSQAELAEIVTSITGNPISYTPLEAEAMIAGMVESGLPRPIAEMIVSFDQARAQGKFAGVTTVVEDLSGHKPTTVRDFLMAHKDALLPSADV